MPQLEIDQLALRMPGADAMQAKLLAAAVAERLASQPLARGGELARLELRVPWPNGTTDARLADAIADAILQAVHHMT